VTDRSATLADLRARDVAASPVGASGHGRTRCDDRLDRLFAEAFAGRDAELHDGITASGAPPSGPADRAVTQTIAG
jgi:hypothetical protein